MKTAVLRAVSHDLRTPLMAILTSASALAQRRPRARAATTERELVDDDPRRGRAARPAGRQPARPLATARPARRSPSPSVWAVDDLVVAGARRARRGGRPRRGRAARGVAGRAGRRAPDRARAREPDRERAQVLAARRSRSACRSTRRRAEVLVRVVDHGPGIAPDEPRADLRAVPARRRTARPRRRARARDRARLRRGERRPRLGRVAARARARRSCSRCPARADGAGVSGAARPRRRRRAADPARAADEPARRRLRGRDGRHRARRALAAAAMRPPEAVILDLVLPDGTGTDVVRELRTWSSAPVIVLSAVGEEREKVAALDAGADDYVTKPVGIDELLARLRAVLRRRTSRRPREPVIERRRARSSTSRSAQRAASRGRAPVHLTPAPVRPAAACFARQRGQAADAPDAPAGGWGPAATASESNLLHVTSRSCGARSSPTRRGRATSLHRARRRLPARRSGRYRAGSPQRPSARSLSSGHGPRELLSRSSSRRSRSTTRRAAPASASRAEVADVRPRRARDRRRAASPSSSLLLYVLERV